MSASTRQIPLPRDRRQKEQDASAARRAMERAEGGLSEDDFGIGGSLGPPRRVEIRPSAQKGQSQPRRQAPMPNNIASRGNHGTIGSAILRPANVAQRSQWSVSEDVSHVPQLGASPPKPRGHPPQRPPRPNDLPSIIDPSQNQASAMAYPQQQHGESRRVPVDYNSSTPKTPKTPTSIDTGSDLPSATFSDGSIPDFPVPAMSGSAASPSRRSQTIGPPPSARRGASSYYSQTSYVTPILEEISEAAPRHGGSFASSRVIPSSWGSHPDDYNTNSYQARFDEETSPYSQSDDSAGLVRQASFGKKVRPTLTTIKSSDELVKAAGQSKASPPRGVVPAIPAAVVIANNKGKAPQRPVLSPAPGTRTVLIDTPPLSTKSSVETSLGTSPTLKSPTYDPISRSRSPLASTHDRSAVQAASPISSQGNAGGMSDKIPSSRRPPRLNIDAVKEAEARGSLSSLPELIRRATKLAANLDRGKTASRLGMLDVLNLEKKEYEKYAPNDQRSGSISDILASFPPPGLATPTGDRPQSRWPSPFSPSRNRASYHETLGSGSPRAPRRPGRRCCGMPVCGFIILAITLLLLVSAAVLVPVFLIVLPRRNQPAAAPTTDGLANCPNSAPCLNGGVSVVTANACRCVCVNGFTGERCGTAADAGCTTTDIVSESTSFRDATVGSAIPRLLNGASGNFSIALDAQAILSLFSSINLSCTSENALMTLGGHSSKQKRFYPIVEPQLPDPEAALLPASPMPTAQPSMNNRAIAGRQNAATSNGIVYAQSTLTGASSTSTSPPVATETAASGGQVAGMDADISQTTLDFSRIAILFIFQETAQLNSAVGAQEKIQSFLFGTATNLTTLDMLYNDMEFIINFGNFSIGLENGTYLGGKGDGSGKLSSKRSVDLWT